MKSIKTILTVFMSLLVALVSAGGIHLATGIPLPWLFAGLAVLSFIPTGTRGVAFAGIYKEIWTGEVLKAFERLSGFLEKVSDYSRFAQNDVIHLVDVDVDPEVLINNNTYPLTTDNWSENDLSISLDKLETKPSRITEDELFAASYQKIATATQIHKQKLIEAALKRSVHAFAPAADGAKTPLITTTGGDNGSGIKRATMADIVELKAKFDAMGVPNDGNRVLVLNPQHANDLLLVDEAFKQQYMRIEAGKLIARLFGFAVYEYIDTPMYNASLNKKAYGSTVLGTDVHASVAFYGPRMFKAKGSAKSYLTRATATDKRNTASFVQRFVALPKKQEAIGALASGTV